MNIRGLVLSMVFGDVVHPVSALMGRLSRFRHPILPNLSLHRSHAGVCQLSLCVGVESKLKFDKEFVGADVDIELEHVGCGCWDNSCDWNSIKEDSGVAVLRCDEGNAVDGAVWWVSVRIIPGKRTGSWGRRP